MQVQVSHHDWRVLREVLRGRGKPVAGKKLRMEMTRRTKDGSHLRSLIHYGLVSVSGSADHPYQATYVLTELGKHAAEYGVYDQDWDTYKAIKDAEPTSRAEEKPIGRKK